MNNYLGNFEIEYFTVCPALRISFRIGNGTRYTDDMGVDRQVLLTKLGSFRFDPDLSV